MPGSRPTGRSRGMKTSATVETPRTFPSRVMIRIVYEGREDVESSNHVVAYDETTDHWVIAPEGRDADLRRRIPRERVYFVESDEADRVGTW